MRKTRQCKTSADMALSFSSLKRVAAKRAPGAGLFARVLTLSTALLLSISLLGASNVRPASPEAKTPAVPAVAPPASQPAPATQPAPSTRPAAVGSGAQSAQWDASLAARPARDVKPRVQLAAYRLNAIEMELLQDAPPAPAAKKAKTLRMEVTAYCPCTRCCGPAAHGVTASGLPVSHNGGEFVAADTDLLQFGTRLRIPGYADARPVEVIDRGGAIKGHKLDVYFPTHEEALEWGRRWLDVTVVD